MKIPKSEYPGKQDREIIMEVGAECRLSGAPESLQSAIRNALTIDNPKYKDAKRYSRWVGKHLKPTLTFCRSKGASLIFPRGFGNKAVLLCRKLIGSSPVLVDNRRKVDPVAFSFHGELRPYQEEAVDAVCSRSFGVLEAGTGSGKTVMALGVIARRSQPTLVVVHSKELLFQWKERIAQFLEIEAGQAGDGMLDVRPVTVGIVNTVRKNLDSLPSRFGHLIVDECHRVPASLFTDVVSAFDAYYMLGLSATAFRREDGMTKLIYTYMGDRVHRVDTGELTASGAIVQPEFEQRPTLFTYGYRGEYSRLIKALAKNEQRNRLIATDIVEIVRQGHQGTILVVSDRVAHCQIFAAMLEEHGVRVVVLTGRTPNEKRQEIVQDVLSGRVEVLAATLQLIGEGFDCPGLTTLILATPIKFQGRLLQVVGRIMRPNPGKKALVIDYIDTGIPVLRRSAQARRELFEQWG